MKIGLSTYSFHKCNPPLSIYEILDKIKEFGAECVDFFPELKKEGCKITVDLAKDIKDYMDKIGLKAVCVCPDTEFFGPGGVEAARDTIINDWLPVAKALGSPALRFDISYKGLPASENDRSFERVIELIAPAIREIADAAEAMGIKVCTENHGRNYQDPARTEKLINSVSHSNFGALVDMGNFTGVDGNHTQCVSSIAHRAVHVHAKDYFIRNGMMDDPGRGYSTTKGYNYVRATIVGHGNVPIKPCLKILKNAGYKGCVAIEFEGMEDPLVANQIGCENLTRYLKEIDALS